MAWSSPDSQSPANQTRHSLQNEHADFRSNDFAFLYGLITLFTHYTWGLSGCQTWLIQSVYMSPPLCRIGLPARRPQGCSPAPVLRPLYSWQISSRTQRSGCSQGLDLQQARAGVECHHKEACCVWTSATCDVVTALAVTSTSVTGRCKTVIEFYGFVSTYELEYLLTPRWHSHKAESRLDSFLLFSQFSRWWIDSLSSREDEEFLFFFFFERYHYEYMGLHMGCNLLQFLFFF